MRKGEEELQLEIGIGIGIGIGIEIAELDARLGHLGKDREAARAGRCLWLDGRDPAQPGKQGLTTEARRTQRTAADKPPMLR